MAATNRTIHVEPESEAGSLLREADEAPVEIEAGGSRYLLTKLTNGSVDHADEREVDAILGIIGIGASEEPTNIARQKQEYLADAANHRSRR